MGAEQARAQRAVEELAAYYKSKARTVSRAAVAIGAFAGVLVGSIPLSPLRDAWPIPSSYGVATLLGGLIVGVLIGYVIGDPRGKLYERMAQQARLQLQLEQRISQNDARMAQLLTALTARAAAAERQRAEPARRPLTPVPAAVPVYEVPQAYTAPLPHLRAVSAAQPEPSAPPLSPPRSGERSSR